MARKKEIKNAGSKSRRTTTNKVKGNEVVDASGITPLIELDPGLDESLFEPLAAGALDFDNNEEYQAAKTEKPAVDVVVDESSQVILERIAQAESETPWHQTQPLEMAVEEIRHLLPNEGRGMRFKALSDRITARKGRRNWEPLKHPTTGQEIKVQGLTLCWMPEVAARRRSKHWQDLGNDAIKEAQANFRQNAGDIIRDAQRQGINNFSVLDSNEVLTNTDPRDAALYGHQEAIGVDVIRGELRSMAGARAGLPQLTPDMEAAVQAEIARRMELIERAG